MARLPVSPSLAVAFHLALPIGVVPQVAIRARLGEFYYRGAATKTAANVYVTAARLAAMGHQPDDVYLDLSEQADPHSWIKVVRSGSRLVAFGTATLFGAPEISLIPGVRLTALNNALDALAQGTLAPPSMMAPAGRS
jgi:hypothetical protein